MPSIIIEKSHLNLFDSPSILQKKSLQFFFEKKINPEILPQIYRQIPLQIFLKKNPFDFFSFLSKGVNFTKEIPLIFFRKKINFSKLRPRGRGPSSQRPFFQKLSLRGYYWGSNFKVDFFLTRFTGIFLYNFFSKGIK